MSGSVQAAILLPVALGIFLLLVQWSMLAWADAVALAAAEHGAAVTAVQGGTESDGRRAAQDAAGGGALADVRVAVSRGPGSSTVTVSGASNAVLWPGRVSRTVVVPNERLTGS